MVKVTKIQKIELRFPTSEASNEWKDVDHVVHANVGDFSGFENEFF